MPKFYTKIGAVSRDMALDFASLLNGWLYFLGLSHLPPNTSDNTTKAMAIQVNAV